MSWSEDVSGPGRSCSSTRTTARCCAAPLLELASPVLGAAGLARLLEHATVLDATAVAAETLGDALERLAREAADAEGIVVLSDRRAELDPACAPIPMALAVGAVHEHLLERGRRLATDIVAVAGDVVDVHDIACLITVGASA